MVVLFYSLQDPAAVHAAQALRELRPNAKTKIQGFDAWHFGSQQYSVQFDLVELQQPALTFQQADDFGASLAVFLSRHASASKKTCFTCHTTGNFGPPTAGMGGLDRLLSRVSALWLKRFYFALKQVSRRASLEATHHGPSLTKTSVVFVETGSDESEWKKPENGRLLAQSVLAALEDKKPQSKVALGFGGNHYCAPFVPLLEQGWAFSHVASKHSVDFVTKEMLQQAVQKTVEPVDCVFLDKKGLPAVKRKEIENWCGELGLAFEVV